MLELIAVKAPGGYYISRAGSDYYSPSTNLLALRYNGASATPTFDRNWVFVDQYPEKIEIKSLDKTINERYELIDEDMASEKIPVSIPYEEACEETKDGWEWREKYSNLRSLYRYNYDKQEGVWELVEFSLVVLLSLEDAVKEPPVIEYRKINGYNNEKTGLTKFHHQTIDSLLFPSFMAHTKPAMIKSVDLYGIIRAYIKENINLQWAKITSDYDFCFTVEKNLRLASPYNYLATIGTGRKTKTQKVYVSERKVKIFEMTHKDANYRGYTAIDDMVGENDEDLKHKIDDLLTSIITRINEPLIECPHCEGRGVILDDQESHNLWPEFYKK